MSTKRKVPDFVAPNIRAFRVQKRAELRLVMNAFDDLWSGGAYLPSHGLLSEIRGRLNELREAMSVKNWGQ